MSPWAVAPGVDACFGTTVGTGLMLRKGEKVAMKGRMITVTKAAFDCLPRVPEGQTITYGELCEELDLPYLAPGHGTTSRPVVGGLFPPWGPPGQHRRERIDGRSRQ